MYANCFMAFQSSIHIYQQEIVINSLFATFADLHVRKVARFANLHSYTHAYCSFVSLNEAIPIVSGSQLRTVRMRY